MSWNLTRRGGLSVLAALAVTTGLLTIEPPAGPAQTAKVLTKKSKGHRRPFKHGHPFMITLEREANEEPYGTVTNARCMYKDPNNQTIAWPVALDANNQPRITVSHQSRRVTIFFNARRAALADDAKQEIPPLDNDSSTVDVTIDDSGTEDPVEDIPVIEVEVDPCP